MTTTIGALAREPVERARDYSTKAEPAAKPIKLAKKRARATPVLYMLSPQKFMSPFDINMAIDSGYKVIMPFDNVALSDINGLVQDAIFSRPPENCARTGLFIGGKDINLALEMMHAAQKAMLPPFEVSVFADPGGSFTTAASMVACVERVLARSYRRKLRGLNLAVFGAGGVVGFASSVIAAIEGARVRMVAHDTIEPIEALARIAEARFGVRVEPVLGNNDVAKAKLVREAEIVLSAGPPGVRIVSRKQTARASNLMIAADVNAIAPTGIEGIEPFMDGIPLPGSSTLGIGPLTIGDVKYKTQAGLFKQMLTAQKSLELDFRHAYVLARQLTRERARDRKPQNA